MAKVDVSIIIVSYNSQFWLETTLKTLKAMYLSKTKREVEVIVVDNGSSEDNVKLLHREFKWVTTIPLETNIGFSAGNNIGLKQAKGEYVMLLNSDVESTADSNLDLILDYLDENPAVGVVTPRLQLSTGELDWACHRGEPGLWASFTYMSGLGKIFPKSQQFGQYHLSYLDVSQTHQVDACSGAAMVVRASAIKKVGLLDEQFFFYAEDLDWCRRFRDAGYEIIFFPAVTLIHHKYKSGLSSSLITIKRSHIRQ